MDASVSVDEHAVDQGQPRDPIQEIQAAPTNATPYETSDDDAVSVVPPGQARNLDLVTVNSELVFTTPGTHPFAVTLKDKADDRAHCFAAVTCIPQST